MLFEKLFRKNYSGTLASNCLDPNCLQRLSADINVATSKEGITIKGLKF